MTPHDRHINVSDKLKKLFDACRLQAGNQNLIESAKKLYSKVDDKDMFMEEFVAAFKYCLVYRDKMAVDRILSFVSKFVASLYSNDLVNDSEEDESENEHLFVNGFLNFLSKMHWATSIDVRVRCVTLIHYILTALPEGSLIPAEMWKCILDTVRSRLQDKNSQVRVAAVLAARKLQEPTNPKCEIMKLLAFHIYDPAPGVRRAVISSIALCKSTFPLVLARTLDVNENVRRNAFAIMAKVRFVNLTISQRVTILERGLKDRAERVQACVETVVLSQWLSHVNRDVLKFLEQIDAVNCPVVAILALEAMLRVEPTEDILKCLPFNDETHCVPDENLTPESALLWRCLAEHCLKNSMEDELDSITPDLTTFCKILNSCLPLEEGEKERSLNNDEQWAEVERKRVLEHLVEIAKVFDLKDEVGRMNLRKTVITLLSNPRICDQNVEQLVDLFRKVVPDTNDFLQTLIEVVSDIREPLNQASADPPIEDVMEKQMQLSGYKLTLNDLQEREYTAVQNKNYSEAADLKEKIQELNNLIEQLNSLPSSNLLEVREERNDPETVCKCLSIIVHMIKVSGVCDLTPALRSLQDEFISKCLQSANLLTQSLALQALAQLCVLDEGLARDHLLGLLFMLSETGDNEINIPVLKAVFDIFQAHGMAPFANLDDKWLDDSTVEQSKGKTLLLEDDDEVLFNSSERVPEATPPGGKCVSLLKELLNCSTNDELKRTAFEGFCKMLVTGAIYSPSLLKTIIIKGYTPIRGNESEDRIRQIFMVFFPVFARNTLRSQEMIEAAFIPVMRELSSAQLGSPEVDINPRDVATFLIHHTQPGINPHSVSTLCVHNSLAVAICLEILRDVSLCVDLGFDQNYLKALLHLQINLDNEVFTQQLLVLVAKICKEINDSSSLRQAKMFQKKLMESVPGDSFSIQNTLRTTRQSTIEGATVSDSTNDTTQQNRTSITETQHLDSPKGADEADTTILENSTSSEKQTNGCGVIEESTEISDDSDDSEFDSRTPAHARRRKSARKS